MTFLTIEHMDEYRQFSRTFAVELRMSGKPKHGHQSGGKKSPTYRAWDNMLQRVKLPAYADRSITVCDRWRKFENFLADMGERPDGLSLDRIDNGGNYEPGNCRWTTWSVQMKNRRSSAASLANLRYGRGPEVCGRDERGRLVARQ